MLICARCDHRECNERCLVCARDVLLIDEMSLITPNMLADIDRALKKATRCEHDFGNWLVVLSTFYLEISSRLMMMCNITITRPTVRAALEAHLFRQNIVTRNSS